jgi:CheY-like chemotaxis protein
VKPANPPPPRQRLRVLVVDDEPDTVTMLLALLRKEGHEARGHASAQAAIQVLRDFDPDVVISDIVMPSMNGWVLAREVRKLMGDKRPVLIAISGRYNRAADKADPDDSGFNHFLTKPADPEVVLSLVASAAPAK